MALITSILSQSIRLSLLPLLLTAIELRNMSLKCHPPHPKWTTRTLRKNHAKNRTVRTKLSEEQVQKLSDEMKKQFKWDSNPREFQLQGVRAQVEGVDMIIQASTGSGKTAIAAGPHVWAPCKGKVTIMVSPLLALEEEMVNCVYSFICQKNCTYHTWTAGGYISE